MQKKTSKSRNFCFTDFVLDKEFWTKLYDTENISYILIGEEICPTTGRKHGQGYIRFDNPRSFGGVIKLLSPRHVELCHGNEGHNYDYCVKDGKVWLELGHKSNQGCRTDLTKIKDDLLENKVKIEDVIVENPFMYHQYGRTLDKIDIIRMNRNFRTEMTTCDWYYGPTGTGKSHRAFMGYHPDTHYVLNTDDKGWWDGYRQQPTVIINEFRGELKLKNLLDLIDKWPTSVPNRNNKPINFTSKHIIITSCQHPKDVYKNLDKEDKLDQLYRRIKIFKMEQKYSGVILDPEYEYIEETDIS